MMLKSKDCEITFSHAEPGLPVLFTGDIINRGGYGVINNTYGEIAFVAMNDGRMIAILYAFDHAYNAVKLYS